jgi:anti-sigma-K factor RskA
VSTPSLEDIALHAVNALEPSAVADLERAVAASPALQAELSAMQSVLAKLGRSLPQHTPPPALEARVLQRVRTQERTPLATRSLTTAPRRAAMPWARPAIATVSLMGLALVAFLGVRSNQLQTQLDAFRARNTQQTAILSSASNIKLASTTDNATPIGQAFLTSDGKIVIALKLPAPQVGKTYQAWFIPRGETAPRPLETFSDTLTTAVPADAAAIAVSLEPSGGSKTPTTVLGVGAVQL